MEMTEELKAAYAREMYLDSLETVNSEATEAWQQSGISRSKALYAAQNAQGKLIQTTIILQSPVFKTVKDIHYLEGHIVAMDPGTRVELVKGKKGEEKTRTPVPASIGDLVSVNLCMNSATTIAINDKHLKAWYCGLADMDNETYNAAGRAFRRKNVANAFLDNAYNSEEYFVRVILNPFVMTDTLNRPTGAFMNPGIWVNWRLDENAEVVEVLDWQELWPNMADLTDSTSGNAVAPAPTAPAPTAPAPTAPAPTAPAVVAKPGAVAPAVVAKPGAVAPAVVAKPGAVAPAVVAKPGAVAPAVVAKPSAVAPAVVAKPGAVAPAVVAKPGAVAGVPPRAPVPPKKP